MSFGFWLCLFVICKSNVNNKSIFATKNKSMRNKFDMLRELTHIFVDVLNYSLTVAQFFIDSFIIDPSGLMEMEKMTELCDKSVRPYQPKSQTMIFILSKVSMLKLLFNTKYER